MKQFSAVLMFLLSLNLSAQRHHDDCAAHPHDQVKHDEHCALFALVPEDHATFIAVNSGNWFDENTWNNNVIPTPDSDVLIDTSVIVTYNGVSLADMHTILSLIHI